MLENKRTGEVTTTNTHPLTELSYYLQAYAYVDEKVLFTLPSPHITPVHMLELAKETENSLSQYDGIVITHGTDTLEETAYFLDLVIETEKPIILTGAMRSSNEIGSDALYNLISSLRVAVEKEASNKGVLVVMNDEIHTAKNVTKTSTSNVATFQSPQYGPIGIVTKDAILFHHTVLTRYTYPVKEISKTVYLLKAYAGMEASIIQAINQSSPDGLVIEALGQGNLPREVTEVLGDMIRRHIPVIIVSRCYQGIVQPTYSYKGGGSDLQSMGMILANGLNGPKARLKLLIALEIEPEFSALKRIFEEEY
ncbi:asparaginase [Virgibacillus kimchii]